MASFFFNVIGLKFRSFNRFYFNAQVYIVKMYLENKEFFVFMLWSAIYSVFKKVTDDFEKWLLSKF